MSLRYFSLPSAPLPLANIPLNRSNAIGWKVWLSALVAIAMFSVTAPVTKEALAGYSIASIGAGRGVIGGAIAILVIQFSGWRLPDRSVLLWIVLSSPGLVFGFPFLITWALTEASSADVGVVLAALPQHLFAFEVAANTVCESVCGRRMLCAMLHSTLSWV